MTRQANQRDDERIRKELRQERMKESRRRQEENKLRRLRERQERAEAWRARKQREILYLGEGVSGGLNSVNMDAEKLMFRGLPLLLDAEDLAVAMEIGVGELRFLSYARRVATVGHYRRFQIPKKSGGLRPISAPMPRLKRRRSGSWPRSWRRSSSTRPRTGSARAVRS